MVMGAERESRFVVHERVKVSETVNRSAKAGLEAFVETKERTTGYAGTVIDFNNVGVATSVRLKIQAGRQQLPLESVIWPL